MSEENSVIKVETFKSGHFALSANFNRTKLEPYLIKAKAIYRSIKYIPILPELMAILEEELIKKSIFGTAAIEGNPLSQEEVDKVISENKDTKDFIEPEIQISNLKKVYRIIKKVKTDIKNPYLLNEKIIKRVHSHITTGTDKGNNEPGVYRNELRKVGDTQHGGVYIPPKNLVDIKKLMEAFIQWINSPILLKQDAAIRAALAHYYLALIHPFGNGNGRTARAIEAILLRSAGVRYVSVMLSNYYYRNIDEYFKSFSISERDKDHDITYFLEFFLKGLLSSFEEIQKRIITWIKITTLREYYRGLSKQKKISQRQHDLLNTLIDTPLAFTLKSLFDLDRFKPIYRKVTERTARRDLHQLMKKAIIKKADEDKYELNFDVLDFSG